MLAVRILRNTSKKRFLRSYLNRYALFGSKVEELVVKSPFVDAIIPNVQLHEYVWQNLDKWPEKTAVVCGITGRGYTFEQAFKLSNNFAAFLRSKLHLQDGDCIAIVMPNGPDYPVAFLGSNEAGLIVTTINPVYKPDEIQRQLLLSEAKAVVADSSKVADIRKALELAKLSLPIIATNTMNGIPDGTISFSEIVEDNSLDKSCLKKVKRSTNDIALLPYSSGTTGLPKGVELSNRNLIANCEQQNDPGLIHFALTTDTKQESILTILPMFHIYAIGVIMLHKLSHGCKLVTLPSFQMDTYINAIMKYRITGMYVAPPLVLAMGSHSAMKAEHFSTLDFIVSGAAPLAPADVQRVYDKAGKEVFLVQGYGLTEASPVVTFQNVQDLSGKCGPPLPSTDCLIVDENGKPLGRNQAGEIWIKGPQVMKGYKDNPKANAEVFTDDGWLKTGDIGMFDEQGLLSVTDRLKELIKVKGFQVAPAELEAVLREHPGVKDAAVVGVPDSRTGETPRGFVVLKPESKVRKEDIMEFVESKVAPFKKLSDVTFLDSIPKSAAGKILRKDIKARYC